MLAYLRELVLRTSVAMLLQCFAGVATQEADGSELLDRICVSFRADLIVIPGRLR